MDLYNHNDNVSDFDYREFIKKIKEGQSKFLAEKWTYLYDDPEDQFDHVTFDDEYIFQINSEGEILGVLSEVPSNLVLPPLPKNLDEGMSPTCKESKYWQEAAVKEVSNLKKV